MQEKDQNRQDEAKRGRKVEGPGEGIVRLYAVVLVYGVKYPVILYMEAFCVGEKGRRLPSA